MAKFYKGSDSLKEAHQPKSYLLYGGTGTGKSKSLATLPGKTIVIKHPFEPHYDHFKEREDLVVAELEAHYVGPENNKTVTYFYDFLNLKSQLHKLKAKGFQNIAFDSLTSLSLDFESKTIAETGTMEWDNWNDLKQHLMDVVQSTKALGMTTVFICHMEVRREKTGGISLAQPFVRGSMKDSLPHFFSETIFCFSEEDSKGKNRQYYWQHHKNNRAVARSMYDADEMDLLTEQNFATVYADYFEALQANPVADSTANGVESDTAEQQGEPVVA